jgi:hypothetical protein
MNIVFEYFKYVKSGFQHVYNLLISRINLYFTWGKISFNQELLYCNSIKLRFIGRNEKIVKMLFCHPKLDLRS